MQQELTCFQLLSLDNLVRRRVRFDPGPPLQIKYTPRCNRIKYHALEQGLSLLELSVLYFAAAMECQLRVSFFLTGTTEISPN